MSLHPHAGRTARKGRGALTNRSGRFESLNREAVDDGWGSLDEPPPRLETRVEVDTSRTIVAHNDSPDVPFTSSINPYRGCEHGCIYCFARPTHAYLGLSPGTDFESRLYFKPDASAQLTAYLSRRGYRVDPITLGANTDPYQPIERRYQVTRSIIEVLAECRHPLSIVTKSALVERDLDLLAPMAAQDLVNVNISITSLDRTLSRRMEPRAAAPHRRLRTVRTLTEAGVPVNVLMAPIIPVVNDHEIESVLEAVAEAGAYGASYVMLRLPLEIKEIFAEWLGEHFPLKRDHVLNRMNDLHGGKLYDSTFGRRQTGQGEYARLIARRFELAKKRVGLGSRHFPLCTTRFKRPSAGPQMDLF